MRRPRRPGWIQISALLLTTWSAAACTPPPPAVGVRPDGWTQVTLTRDAADTFELSGDERELALRADDTNVGGNTRLIAWREGELPSVDGSACITVDSWSWPAQEGVALGVTTDGGRTRALTVTKNVWAHATTVFNVHRWDTSDRVLFTKLASFDMHTSLGDDASAPHRLCARMTAGVLTLKVWPGGRPEPAWDDPVATRSLEVPTFLRRTARTGVFVGHVEPGSTLRVHDIALGEEGPAADAP